MSRDQQPISDQQRAAILRSGLAEAEDRARRRGDGFEVVERGDFDATFVLSEATNHWLHKRLTIQTLGLWGPVWWWRTRRGTVTRSYRAEVDPLGRVAVRRIRRGV